MIPLIIIPLFLSHVLGEPIVDGELGSIVMHPWLASIQKHGHHKCGGSIISPSIILTAAHCIDKDDLGSYLVRVGSSRIDSGGSLHRIVAVKRHENYQMTNNEIIKLRNDLALIKVIPSIVFGDKVTAVELARREDEVAPGTVVVIAGWGVQSDEGPASVELKTTSLHIRNSVRCSNAYGDSSGTQMRSNNLICATEYGIPGFCYGDSGGPLTTEDGRQVGIISWSNGCDVTFAGVYGDVARYRDWIDTNSNKLESSKTLEEWFVTLSLKIEDIGRR